MEPQPTDLTLEAGICLSLVGVGVDHGYAIARHFVAGTAIGDIYSLTRPAVYRELAALEDRGVIVSSRDVGTRGQAKKRLRLTPRGSALVRRWLDEPVEHLRDMRLDFLAKCVMREMHNLPLAPFAAAQRSRLSPVLDSLASDVQRTPTAMWRREQVRAVSRFLDECEGLVPSSLAPSPMDDSVADDSMVLSARNQLKGTVMSVRHGSILSSVKISVDEGQVLTSTITREASDHLRLSPGSEVTSIFKATDVMVAAPAARRQPGRQPPR